MFKTKSIKTKSTEKAGQFYIVVEINFKLFGSKLTEKKEIKYIQEENMDLLRVRTNIFTTLFKVHKDFSLYHLI